MVDEYLLILGANLVKAKFPELRNDVRVEMGACDANGGRLALGENTFPPAGCKLGYGCDSGWLVGVVIDALEDFIELPGRKAFCWKFLLCAEHDLRSGADGLPIRSNQILAVSS